MHAVICISQDIRYDESFDEKRSCHPIVLNAGH